MAALELTLHVCDLLLKATDSSDISLRRIWRESIPIRVPEQNQHYNPLMRL